MRPERRRRTLGVASAAHFLHDGFSDSLYVLMPLWAEGFGLSLTQVGFMKTAFASTLAGLQLPAGLLAERSGERIVLAIGTAVAGLGYILLGFTGSFLGLVVCLLLIGASSASQHPLASSLVSGAYDGGPRRAALGAYNFSGDLGKMVVPALIALGAATLGWRTSTAAYGLLGLVAGGALYLVMRQLDTGAPPTVAPAPTDGVAVTRRGWGVRHLRGFATLTVIGVIDTSSRFALLTFLPFVLIAKGAAVETVGFALALVFTGGAAGKLACGFAAERVGIVRTVVLTEIATAAGILVILALPLVGVLVLLPLLGLVLNGTSSVLYGTVADFTVADRQARAFGLFYTITVGAGAASPLLYGVLSDAVGIDATMIVVAGVVLMVLPFCHLMGLALAAVNVDAGTA